MSMTSALRNVVHHRQQRFERLQQHDPTLLLRDVEEEGQQGHDSSANPVTGAAVPEVSSTNNNNSHATTTTTTSSSTVNRRSSSSREIPAGNQEEEEVSDSDGIFRFSASSPTTATFTLAELEEERELARRRSSACVVIAVFVLFRLWLEAIQQGDVGLLIICVVGTSWTARWIRHTREREEELDRLIAHSLQENSGNNNSNSNASIIDRNDLRLLSFQAQLALAIMESQRQMMEGGGYGHPDGGESTPGVSEEARAKWHKITFTAKKGDYGSVIPTSVSKLEDDDDEPHCSICLGEYEEGETITKLPCNHVYHEECINSWTQNHVKCPLCNFDLESAKDSATTTTRNAAVDSVV